MPNVTLFATNLHNPSHMEWTPDGRLLVSEYSAGTIRDITGGGDMRDVPPFAFGLSGPAAILPHDSQLLVAESWAGTIRDISAGGDVSKVTPFTSGLSCPYSLIRLKQADGYHLFVSEDDSGKDSWISDVTRGKGQSSKYVTDLPSRPGAPGLTPLHSWPNDWEKYAAAKCIKDWQDPGGFSNRHLIAVGVLGQIIDVTRAQNAYIDVVKRNDVIAWDLRRVGGIKTHLQSDMLYACEPEAGNIMRIDPSKKKNYRFEPPVVRGLDYPTCLRFSADGNTMYVCGQADGVVWKITDFL